MASKFIAKYPVPDDFPDLLHDFAREVLRDQPDNIYEYGAQYFKALYMVSITLSKWAQIMTELKNCDFPPSILRGKHTISVMTFVFSPMIY